MSIRTDRVSKLIKEEISLIFLHKIQDPELGLVTVTNVNVTPDLREARIYFSIYDKALRESCLKKINKIKGMIRSELGKKITLKFTPELFFFIDDTLDYVEKMERIFKKSTRMINNTITDLSNSDFSAGEVLLMDKESGWTSFDVVNKVRRLTGVKKVGHAGTLDPTATGLLILCTGKKTKSISDFQNLDKTYTGIIELGKKTESMDGETPFIEEHSVTGIRAEGIEKVKEEFIGEISQIPPMFSALKYKGKALYKYAREGKVVERKPRKISVYNFEITRIDLPEIYFSIKCSKGTYIRVIANDFGEKLECGGYLKKLRRTAIGENRVENALTIVEFENLMSTVA